MDKLVMAATAAIAVFVAIVVVNRSESANKIEIGTLMLAAGAAGGSAVMAVQRASQELSDKINATAQQIDARLDRIEREQVESNGLTDRKLQALTQQLDGHIKDEFKNQEVLRHKLEELKINLMERLDRERELHSSKIDLIWEFVKKHNWRWF
jgi:predicted RNase H-like nuclease (RuvC/YqgF family)